MNRAYYDWPALAVLLAVLGWVAYQFSRRTYRLTVGALAAGGVLAVTAYGLRLPGKHPTFASGLLAAGNALSRTMLGAFIPAGLQHTLLLGPTGWLLLPVLIGSLLAAFDTLSARRQQPTVHLGTVPPGDSGSDSRDMHARRAVRTNGSRHCYLSPHSRPPDRRPSGLCHRPLGLRRRPSGLCRHQSALPRHRTRYGG